MQRSSGRHKLGILKNRKKLNVMDKKERVGDEVPKGGR